MPEPAKQKDLSFSSPDTRNAGLNYTGKHLISNVFGIIQFAIFAPSFFTENHGQ
jgi:hypothetical protein